MPNYYLAIDIGASSGRHILGWRENGVLRTKEIYRFPNGVQAVDGHLTWDLEGLLSHVRTGITAAKMEVSQISCLSIDTWGVDYVLLREGEVVSPCFAYRDSRTQAVVEQVHAQIPFAELYRRTGCQFQPFNTIYQLCDDLAKGRLEHVTGMLMIPEYLLYKLTGIAAREYTNATTTGLVNAETGQFDLEITDRLGLPRTLFPTLSQPGTALGVYEGIPVRLCATHDTASAVEGIPMEGNQLYISSGTWSLLGVKTPAPLTDPASQAGNWSNEGGVGYNRYQKNIMGMWLINELKRELCPDRSFPEILEEAEKSQFDALVDANDSRFLAPARMQAAFDAALPVQPQTVGDYFRCACRSLAASYAAAIAELERNTGKTYDKLYIVGGGAKNQFLNRLTAQASGKEVVALAIEATALGNLHIQMEG